MRSSAYILLSLLFSAQLLAQIQEIAEAPSGKIWTAVGNELKLASNGKMEEQSVYSAASEIQALMADEKGNVWIGTETEVIRLDATGTSRKYPIGTPVRSLSAGESGTVWAGSEGAIHEIRESTIKEHSLEDSTNRIEALHVDRKGVLWIASRNGIGQFRDGSFQIVSNNFGNSIAEDSEGSLWIGSGNDLLRIRDGRTETFGLPPPPANVRMMPAITSVLAERSGRILIGTSSGLLEWKNRKFERIDNDEVLCLLQTKDGSIWISTPAGLRKIR